MDIRRLLAVQKGQAIVEYVLLISFVAIVCIAGLKVVGINLSNFFTGVNVP